MNFSSREAGMLKSKSMCFVVSILLLMMGCTGITPQRLIEQQDHAALVGYYTKEAQALRQKAQEWEFMAEFYGLHPESYTNVAPARHEAHCRSIAESYRKAADEAEALARKHRDRLPEPRRD